MMKKCNIYLIVLSLVIFSSINVFAEETNIYSYKVTVENGEATAVEEELFSEVDNSDLMVDVIREDQGVRTTIYSGVLSGYDNGQWIHMDFSTIQFAVIFDWNESENNVFNEVVYIIPRNDVYSNDAIDCNKKGYKDSDNTVNLSKTSNEMAAPIMTVESEDAVDGLKIKKAIFKNDVGTIIHGCTSNGKVDSVTIEKNIYTQCFCQIVCCLI